VGTIAVPELSDSGPLAMTQDAAWARLLDGSVIHIDLESGQLVSTIDVGGGEFGDIAAGDDAVWVTTFDENTVSRIDPISDEIVAVIGVGENPEDLLVTPDAVWVSNHRGGSLSRIDPATNQVVATVKVGPKGPSGPKEIALVGGDLWTAIPNANAVVRVDPDTNKAVSAIDVNFISSLIGAEEWIYAASGTVGRISILDPSTEAVVSTAEPPAFPAGFGLGSLWGTDAEFLFSLDESTLEPIEAIRISTTPTAIGDIAFTGDSIWLVLPERGELIQVQP